MAIKIKSVKEISGLATSLETVYLAGPVTGIPRKQVERNFNKYRSFYQTRGFGVISPIDQIDENVTWQEAMKIALTLMMQCDFIFMLPGWESSLGACMEKEIADKVGIKLLTILRL